MRGDDPRHESMFSYVTPEQRVRADHPLRLIRRLTDTALTRLSPRFERLYSTTGRPSIPPEQLLRALLLQMLYSIRSERLLVEELDYSVLYRWFVGLSMDDPIWTRPRLPRTATACSPAISPTRSSPKCSPRSRRRACCPMSISRSMARCWRPGQARRVSSRRPAHTPRPTTRVIRRLIFTGRRAAMTRISPPPTRRRGSIAKGIAARRSSRIWGTCSPRIATASSSTPP